MSSFLQTLEADAVVAALEANLYDLYRFMGESGERVLVDEGDFSWVNASPSWPRFLFDPRFPSSGISGRLREIASRIEKHEIPNVLQVGPSSRPADLSSHLVEAGFEKLPVHRPGMALDLTRWEFREEAPDELSVIHAHENADVKTWATLDSGTDPDLYLKLVSDERIKLYIGTLDGVPVARSMVFFSSGVVGLYLVSVLEPFRNRGIGTAMTVEPLLDAREDGYHVSVLMATELGERIYSKIGFEKFMELEYYGCGG